MTNEIYAGDTAELYAAVTDSSGNIVLPVNILGVTFTVTLPDGTSVDADGIIQNDGYGYLRFTDTAQEGTYVWRARFELSGGEIRSYTDEFDVIDALAVDTQAPRIGDVAAIKPTVDAVSAMMQGRVSEGSGSFDADTRPTAAQVQTLIDLAADEVFSRCEAIPVKSAGLAKQVVALAVAIQIERGYFPQEQDDSLSVLDDLRADFNVKVVRLEFLSRLAWVSTLP